LLFDLWLLLLLFLIYNVCVVGCLSKMVADLITVVFFVNLFVIIFFFLVLLLLFLIIVLLRLAASPCLGRHVGHNSLLPVVFSGDSDLQHFLPHD